MTKAGTGGGSSSSRLGAAARRPVRGSMTRRAERGSGWTRGGWAGSGGAGGRGWVSRGRHLLMIPRGKARGRGRVVFSQRAGVVRLFRNPIKEARGRLLRGGRKGIGREARFKSRKMVKGGISKPTRGGCVPDDCSLATLDTPQSIAILLPSLPVLFSQQHPHPSPCGDA